MSCIPDQDEKAIAYFDNTFHNVRGQTDNGYTLKIDMDSCSANNIGSDKFKLTLRNTVKKIMAIYTHI